MRILICGGRDYSNVHKIITYVDSLQPDDVVIHGAARGADSHAGFAAHKRDLAVFTFPAQWNRHGKSAGYLRNQRMLEVGQPDLVVYFHDNLADSKGTLDMVERAKKAAIEVLGNPAEAGV